MVLFYCDLPRQASPFNAVRAASQYTVERKYNQEELQSSDSDLIVNFWNTETSKRLLYERFRKGASLWLVRFEGKLAGYGWTLTGCTIEPHYYPLGTNDIHLFDFLVFPEYRGRGVNPCLVTHILDQMTAEGRTRAYIEAAEWNLPQLASLRKTGFQLLGVARKRSLLGRTVVAWGTLRKRGLFFKT